MNKWLLMTDIWSNNVHEEGTGHLKEKKMMKGLDKGTVSAFRYKYNFFK